MGPVSNPQNADTIKFLVRLIPYEEPPASKTTAKALSQTASVSATPAIVAAITAAMAAHLGKSPQELHITQINPK